jgi:hypothetical protein
MWRTFATLVSAIALAGCASGTVLGDRDSQAADVAHLSASAGIVLRVAPLHRIDRTVEIAPIKPLDLRVTAGWYHVAYACDVLYENGNATQITMREYTTEQTLHVHAGHDYKLMCSPKRMGTLQVQDLGLAPNNSFKPKPLRGSA